jgi:hypothetical protein
MELPSAIDAFKTDTKSTINQFLAGKITLSNCLTALAEAFTIAKPKLQPSEFPALTDVVIANNARVMGEDRRRERDRIGARERRRKSKL